VGAAIEFPHFASPPKGYLGVSLLAIRTICEATDYLEQKQMQNKWVQGKVLATGDVLISRECELI